ncbi:F-actin-uncapping protein LRRC16A-like isoform X2 [Watersipora subatra]|uniref:F-actin-uncapping protein LRRC16A-like isoform X2 n=1 Tax=Watersipora subatra TaxID=2589382 RepID=UPI00355B58C6
MLSDDVKGSITAQTKQKFNIAFIRLMNYEVRNDKLEQKVVVLAKHGQRLMVFNNKNVSRLELSIHYLEIKAIDSVSKKELKISYGENKSMRLVSLTQENEVDEIVSHIALQLKTVFPLIPLANFIPKIDLMPTERTAQLYKTLDATIVKDHSACAGFSRMYICMCDVYGYRLVEEIIWDVDTIYLSHDSRTLYLRDFDHLSLKDHVPLIGALQYNEWFTGVDASSMKMTNEAAAEILKVVKRNTSIAEWNLSSTGIKSDFVQKLAAGITSNLTTKFVSLDLTGNAIEDKGMTYLGEAIGNMTHGMQSLVLAQCSVTARGVNKLMEGIAHNHIMANTLHTLNLSSNSLKAEELLQLYQFLAQPNVLQKLDLSDTDSPLDSLFTALSRGSVQHLEELNVSGNPYSTKKMKEVKVASSWKQFFSSSLVLSKLNFSFCKLPALAMKEMFLGLAANVNKPSVDLDLSNNEMKSEGGMVLGGCVASLRNIHGLDLSDNGLDTNLHEILPWFGKNGTIHHLSIGKNFSQLRNKALAQALDALVCAIQDEHCALESLSLADSKLRFDTTVVINALGNSNTLKSLDISGNLMGDIGAKMLAKALTINSTLTNVVWDKNNISAAGLRDVAQSLQRNYTMQEMPLPIFDIAQCAKASLEAIQKASMQIQTCLQRNHAPQKIAYDQRYRLQQGFLVSSSQSIIDKRVHDIHALLNSLSETDNLSPAEFSKTQKLLADADRSKQILMTLQTAVIKCEETPTRFTECVKDVTKSLSASVNSQLKDTQEEMLRVMTSEVNSVLEDKDGKTTFEEGAQSRGSLVQSEISSLIDKHLVSDIQSRISSRNFTVAFYLAESAIDKIVDLLNSKHDELKSMVSSTGSGDDTVSIAPSEMADTIGASGMTFLGDASLGDPPPIDASGDRHTVMNTLRRRPQSILVKDVNSCGSDFSRDMKVEAETKIPEVEGTLEEMSSLDEAPLDKLPAIKKVKVNAAESSNESSSESGEGINGKPRVSQTIPGENLESKRAPSPTDDITGVVDVKSKITPRDKPKLRSLSSRSSSSISTDSNRNTICALSVTADSKHPKMDRHLSTEFPPAVANKPSKTTPPPIAPKLKPKALSMKSPSSSNKEPEELIPSKARKPSESSIPSAAAEPEVKKLPEVNATPALTHLGKERPKRAKKNVTRRPAPAVASVEGDDEVAESVEDFFKPATVSTSPVVVSTSSAKPKPSTRTEKPSSNAKAEKEESPKPEKTARSSTSNSDKKNQDKTTGAAIATGIKDFFKKKTKRDKTVETSDSKPTEVAAPAAKTEATTPTPKPRSASMDIPETSPSAEKSAISDTTEPNAEASESTSLEQKVVPESTTTSAASASVESEGALIPTPKKRNVGIGFPGMSGDLLAEMKSKRTSMQPKATPRPAQKTEDKALPKLEESLNSKDGEKTVTKAMDKPGPKSGGMLSPGTPPARPPALKPPAPSSSDSSKDNPVATTPPARPTPPKPTAAPRETVASAPTKPPALRPKPPPKPAKPAKPSRPSTVIDMPSHSAVEKKAPPKPPPPQLNKRQSYTDPKVSSPTSPPVGPKSSFPLEAVSTIAECTSNDQSSCKDSDPSKSLTCNVESQPVKASEEVVPVTSELSTINQVELMVKPLEEAVSDACTEADSTMEAGGSMKVSSSQGDLTSYDDEESSSKTRGSSSSTRDSIAEEPSTRRRDSERSSGRLSNGSASQENWCSPPTSQSAHLEEGPVLQPPPSKDRKPSEQSAGANSDDDLFV